MAFLENSAATPTDLLNEFMDFLVLHAGFTRLSNLTVAGFTTPVFVVRKGSIYWWFGVQTFTHTYYGNSGDINCRMMLVAPTTTNLLTNTNGQYYRTRVSLFNRPGGPYVKHRFYTDGNEAYCVLEMTPGAYTHFGVGKIPKYGTWVGGEFLVGSHPAIPSTYSQNTGFPASFSTLSPYLDFPFIAYAGHRYNGDTNNSFSHLYNPARNRGNNEDFAAFVSNIFIDVNLYKNGCSGSMPSYFGAPFLGSELALSSKNTFNSRNVINGNLIYLNNNVVQDSTLRWIVAGAPAICRPISMDGLSPGDIVEVSWDVYPYFMKGGDRMAYPDSENMGVAYKRIV